jgi:hypothetical protein
LKFETTARFDGDYRRLGKDEQKLFRATLADFIPAAERRLAEPDAPWPKRLRVKSAEGAPGIWEMTWSFSCPDGRATFEWASIAGEAGIRWRRIGGHAIFREP